RRPPRRSRMTRTSWRRFFGRWPPRPPEGSGSASRMSVTATGPTGRSSSASWRYPGHTGRWRSGDGTRPATRSGWYWPSCSFRPEMLPEVLDVWNAALGDRFPLSRELFVQNAIADPHFDPQGCWVAHRPAPAGVIGICLAKIAREPLAADGVLPDRGWISLLA